MGKANDALWYPVAGEHVKHSVLNNKWTNSVWE